MILIKMPCVQVNLKILLANRQLPHILPTTILLFLNLIVTGSRDQKGFLRYSTKFEEVGKKYGYSY